MAKTLTAEARSGVDVVLVAGDPLTVDAVISEVNAVARPPAHRKSCPAWPAATVDLCRVAAGFVAHRSRRAYHYRLGRAARTGPLILQASHLAESACSLIDHQLAESTPCVVTAHGTTCQQLETTLQRLTDPAVWALPTPRAPQTGGTPRPDR